MRDRCRLVSRARCGQRRGGSTGVDPVCRGCPRWDRDKTGADKAQGAGKDEKDQAKQ